MLQYNPEIIKAYRQLIRPFLNWKGSFSPRKYHRFFVKGKPDRIKFFYDEVQQFVNNLVAHIHQEEAGRNKWSRYFVDLTVLLASNIDIEFRANSIDNRRASVDVTSFDLEDIYKEIACIREEAEKSNDKLCFISVPTDFSLLYNVGDMLTVGFDLSNRKLIYPKLIEVKDNNKYHSHYKQNIKKQRRREFGQAIRFAELHTKYDFFKNTAVRRNFHGRPIFLKNRLIKRLLKKPSVIKIDDTFSLESSYDANLRSNTDYWRVDFIEEIVCGNILPSVFKGLDIQLIGQLMERGIYIYICAHKQAFRKNIKSLEFVSKVDKHHSPYHAYVYFGEMRTSVANLIHVKYPMYRLRAALVLAHEVYTKRIEEVKKQEPKYFYFGP